MNLLTRQDMVCMEALAKTFHKSQTRDSPLVGDLVGAYQLAFELVDISLRIASSLRELVVSQQEPE